MHDPAPPEPHDAAPVEPQSADSLPFTAYVLPGVKRPARLVPAPVGRTWMRETYKQHAHRCLPLLMANQSGWVLLNDATFRVTWNGGTALSALQIEYEGDRPSQPLVSSIFGYGVLTWRVDYLFRTPPGFNLAVRGPANMPKDGICALDGMVETDWAVANFTMNWKVTRAGHPVVFEEGEPFCMVLPQRRHDLERFEPTTVPLVQAPELAAQWQEFHDRRNLMAGARMIAHLKQAQGGAAEVPYERDYMEGQTPGGVPAPEHQRRLRICPFRPG